MRFKERLLYDDARSQFYTNRIYYRRFLFLLSAFNNCFFKKVQKPFSNICDKYLSGMDGTWMGECFSLVGNEIIGSEE